MDNCANNWGREYLDLPSNHGCRRKIGKYTDLENIIKKITKSEFNLCKVCITGSEATHYATLMMEHGKEGTICYATGSYVGGDNTPYQEFSTIFFDIQYSKLCDIADPYDNNVVSSKAKHIAIPFPYYVHESDKQYDNLCLTFIEKQCQMFQIMGKPIIAIVMELMLAGNGAILSYYFMNELGYLAQKYSFNVIVDEIFTGGRTSDDNIF